jgi:electron transport complex protein RnfB
MLATILTMTAMGLILGLFLGISAHYLKVEAEPIVEELEALLPGSNCGQCGYAGCSQAAVALANHEAEVTFCPPGGASLVQALAEKLGVDAAAASMDQSAPMLAVVKEETCIGCTRCFKICPTDAIVGAPKQIHSVIQDACNGCKLCLDVCPTECLVMVNEDVTLDNWRWQKPMPVAATA